MTSLLNFPLLMSTKQIDSTLLWGCSLTDYRRCQNVVKNISDTLVEWLVCHFFVFIKFWCHLWSIAKQIHGHTKTMYLFNITPWPFFTFNRWPTAPYYPGSGTVVTDSIKNYTVEMTLILLRLTTYQRASHEGSTICRGQKPKTCKHWKVQKQGLLQ